MLRNRGRVGDVEFAQSKDLQNGCVRVDEHFITADRLLVPFAGRFRDLCTPNPMLLQKMIDLVRTHAIREILRHRDVSECVRVFGEHENCFRRQLEALRTD